MARIDTTKFNEMLNTPCIDASRNESNLSLLLNNAGQNVFNSLTHLHQLNYFHETGNDRAQDAFNKALLDLFTEVVDVKRLDGLPELLKSPEAIGGLQNFHSQCLHSDGAGVDQEKFRLLFSFIYGVIAQEPPVYKEAIEKSFGMLGIKVMPWEEVIRSTKRLEELTTTPHDRTP